MFRSKRTIIRPTYENLVYEWMDKAFQIPMALSIHSQTKFLYIGLMMVRLDRNM
jgi:hypothetical protein